ncbi:MULTISPECIES: hypothetical protein [Salimicrobium]|uniref:Uncharacterized protein n=2 Tax=Salimicrobium TaxID=351195 RepID=A0ABY1KKP0_9BACI|nr:MULTISPECIES: hypothetical protein [Salimicrobium]SDX41436.1 hypothetical protein SAMN04488081_0443 [Salimicrobium album]SIS46192.1 hypothetical protein SAMN05421758_101267 [Salimicrobium salexigens]
MTNKDGPVEKMRKFIRASGRFFTELVLWVPELILVFIRGMVLTGKWLIQGVRYLLEAL